MPHLFSRSSLTLLLGGVLSSFTSISLADTDFYEQFLWGQHYLGEQSSDGNRPCFQLKAPTLKPQQEQAWRAQSGISQLSMGPNGSGGFFLVWNEGGARIYLQSVNDDGALIWGPRAINPAPTRQDFYSLMQDPQHNLMLAWSEHHYDCPPPGGSWTGGSGQKINTEGAPQWGGKGVSLPGASLQSDGRGGFLTSGMELRDWAGYYALYVQRLDPVGHPLWAGPIEISFASVLPKIMDVQLTPNGDGGFWAVATGTKDWRKSVVQRFTPDGKSIWASPVTVSDGNTNSPNPQLLLDGLGGAFVASTPDGGGGAVIVSRLDGKGNLNWTLTLEHSDRAERARLLPDGQGGVLILWSRRDPYKIEQTYFAQRINGKGQLQWKDKVRLGSMNQGEGARVISDGQGGAFVAWRDSQSLRGSHWKESLTVNVLDVYLQRITSQGDAWKSPALVAEHIGNTGGNGAPPIDLALDSTGGIFVDWADGRAGLNHEPFKPQSEGMDEFAEDSVSGGSSIYAQRATPDGKMRWSSDGLPMIPQPPLKCFSHTKNTYVVASWTVNLREQPATTSPVLRKLYRGTEVQIQSTQPACEVLWNRTGQWVKVKVLKGAVKEGWVFDATLMSP